LLRRCLHLDTTPRVPLTGCGLARFGCGRFAWQHGQADGVRGFAGDGRGRRPPHCRGLGRPRFVDLLDKSRRDLAKLTIEFGEVLIE